MLLMGCRNATLASPAMKSRTLSPRCSANTPTRPCSNGSPTSCSPIGNSLSSTLPPETPRSGGSSSGRPVGSWLSKAELTNHFQPVAHPSRALDPTFVAATLAFLNRPLGQDQADTVSRLCTQGHFVEVVVGRAGTGKTYTMRTVREVYETAGKRLVGVCPTGRAARELADGAGIESFTIPRFADHAHLDARHGCGGGRSRHVRHRRPSPDHHPSPRCGCER